ncbi:MAG: DinB family protein [Bacteroidia bacterium]
MKQVKWFDRNFNFESTQNIFPSVIERLWGTPARLAEKFKSIPPDILTRRINNTWTIKENVGHLTDLEPLWQGRLEDIINGSKELRPADLQNSKTDLANHNEKPINELLYSFGQVRGQTISLLEKIDEETIFKSALHPRLKTPMRTVDLFLFVAEHDDHHLARITELVKSCRQNCLTV